MMRRTRGALWLCAVLCLSCGRCDESVETQPSSAAPLPPVPAPAGLMSEMSIPAPNALLADVRKAMGGPALLLPRTLGGLLVDLLGLPLQAAELFDEQLPVLAASAVEPSGAVHTAVAVHVRSRDRLEQLLTGGSDARFRADKQGDVTHLEALPTLREARLGANVALVDHYLVAGSSREAILALGPYLTRTLSAQKPPKDDLSLVLHEPAFGEGMRARLVPLRDRLSALSLPPGLGLIVDTDALMDGLNELAAELAGGRIDVRLGEALLEMEATFEPKDGEAWQRLSALAVSETAALGRLPDDSVAALSFGQDEAARRHGSRKRAEAIAALIDGGASWQVSDTDALAGALDAVAGARGERTALGLRCTGVGITGFARGDVRDAGALGEGLSALVDLRKQAAVKARLKAASLSLSTHETRILEVPHDVWRWRLTPTQEGAHPRLEAVDLLYLIDGDRFIAAAGMETVDTLQLLYAPSASWSDKAAVKDALARLPRSAWLDALVDPQAIHACALGRPGGAPTMPIALAIGPREGRVFARLEIAAPLIKVAVDELDL